MKKNHLFSGLLFFICYLFVMDFAHTTSAPLWTFSPLTPTTIQLPVNSTALIQYTVSNKTSKNLTLMMVPISGITQVTSAGNCPNPFTLNSKQSCTLTLQVNGSKDIIGGPQVCLQGSDGNPSPFQCYQPNSVNILNVTLSTPQVATLYAGMQNGNVYYSIDNGSHWNAINPPSPGNPINSVVSTSAILYAGVANGTIYSSTNNGNTWLAIATPAPGYSINGLYVSATAVYAASANGHIFICTLNGSNCTPTNTPALGFGVNGVFAKGNVLYATSENGYVYYSNNKGLTWTEINGQPDGSAAKGVYVAANTLYVGTTNENVYTSTSLTGGGSWSWYAQTVYSFFVPANASRILASTQGGYVFSLNNGENLGFITYNPINSVFLLE